MNKLLITVFFSVLLSACGNTQKVNHTSYSKQVGDIVFDKTLDDTAFKLCNEERIVQYYNFSKSVQYEGEKVRIINHFKQHFQPLLDISQTGYVTIRFIVNCEGKTGRFRVQEMDNNYQVISLDKALVTQILKLTKDLDGWIVGVYDNKKFDYYQYLTFKIKNGSIEEIMP
jgi:uncharacterized protein YfbU (UPF0304 family)